MGNNQFAGMTGHESNFSIDVKIAAEVEKIWMNYDLDRNGTLDFNEVSLYLKSRCPHMPEEALTMTFQKMDVNNDQKIDRDEMHTYVKELMQQHHLKK